jgi:glycosyltransferase involved in cell wall biosynthesis
VSDGYDEERIRVIRNGVDLGPFNVAPEPMRIRRQLGLRSDVPLVAVVSRLNRMKGLEHFLESAAIVARRFPDARFLVVGEAPPHDLEYLEELKATTARLGIEDRVIFTGLRSDVPALLRCISVAVMPSLNEALSNSLLESMAAGAPTVATRVGGTPEAVVDGETGLLVPPGDVPALSRSILTLLESPTLARRLGAAARRLVEQHFSIDRMAEATTRVYDDLLERKTRHRVRSCAW